MSGEDRPSLAGEPVMGRAYGRFGWKADARWLSVLVMRRSVSLLLGGILLVSCRTGHEEPISAAKAEELAVAHAAEVLPQVPWRSEEIAITTDDRGALWRVTFSAPGSTGDPLSVEVDKRTGAIVRGLKGPCYDKGADCFGGNHS